METFDVAFVHSTKSRRHEAGNRLPRQRSGRVAKDCVRPNVGEHDLPSFVDRHDCVGSCLQHRVEAQQVTPHRRFERPSDQPPDSGHEDCDRDDTVCHFPGGAGCGTAKRSKPRGALDHSECQDSAEEQAPEGRNPLDVSIGSRIAFDPFHGRARHKSIRSRRCDHGPSTAARKAGTQANALA